MYFAAMDEDFELPFIFQGKEMSYPARLLQFGYLPRIEVDVDELKVLFEKDDEQNWRALISYEDMQANKKVSVELLKAIAEGIENVLR